jgi:hypothetical protein
MSSVPAFTAGWLAMMPTTMPWNAREADHDVLCPLALHFEEISVVHEPRDHLVTCRADPSLAGTRSFIPDPA